MIYFLNDSPVKYYLNEVFKKGLKKDALDSITQPAMSLTEVLQSLILQRTHLKQKVCIIDSGVGKIS